jgi:hypothetical protein
MKKRPASAFTGQASPTKQTAAATRLRALITDTMLGEIPVGRSSRASRRASGW